MARLCACLESASSSSRAAKPRAAPFRVNGTVHLEKFPHGLFYRRTKDIDDVVEHLAQSWESTVYGYDDGDGWLRVGEHFLPMVIDGSTVLHPFTAGVPAASASATHASVVSRGLPMGIVPCTGASEVADGNRAINTSTAEAQAASPIAETATVVRSRDIFAYIPVSGSTKAGEADPSTAEANTTSAIAKATAVVGGNEDNKLVAFSGSWVNSAGEVHTIADGRILWSCGNTSEIKPGRMDNSITVVRDRVIYHAYLSDMDHFIFWNDCDVWMRSDDPGTLHDVERLRGV